MYPNFRSKPKLNKQTKKMLRKELGIDTFATEADMEKLLKDKEDSKRKRQLWASLSPHMKLKLMKRMLEKKEADAKE